MGFLIAGHDLKLQCMDQKLGLNGAIIYERELALHGREEA